MHPARYAEESVTSKKKHSSRSRAPKNDQSDERTYKVALTAGEIDVLLVEVEFRLKSRSKDAMEALDAIDDAGNADERRSILTGLLNDHELYEKLCAATLNPE